MASSGSKGNRQSPCFGYLVVFHAFTPTRAFGVWPQALIFAFDILAKRLFARLRSMFSGAGRPLPPFQHPRQPSAGHAITGVANFFLHFFSRLFVDRNAMVVSLQREKVTGSFAVAPPYLQRQGTPAGEKTGNLLCRRISAGGGEPPQVIKIGRTSAGMKAVGSTRPLHGDDTKNGTKDSGRRMKKLWLF